MNDHSTTILNPQQLKEPPKAFSFDYSYWSHDGFRIRDDGYYESAKKKYSDQVENNFWLLLVRMTIV